MRFRRLYLKYSQDIVLIFLLYCHPVHFKRLPLNQFHSLPERETEPSQNFFRGCQCPYVTDQSVKDIPRAEDIKYAHAKREDINHLDENTLEDFKVSPRPLYLDPFNRPLITFPMAQNSQHFSVAKKYKINQQILDGYLDPSQAIIGPLIMLSPENGKEKILCKNIDFRNEYNFELPEEQYEYPVQNKTIETTRIHGCCTFHKSVKEGEATPKKARRPYKRPKPWLLSRHTDFDFISQW